MGATMAANGTTNDTTQPRSGAARGPTRRVLERVQPRAARRRRRTRRILASRGVFDAIVSLVGLIGRPVRNQAGQEIGRLVDVLAQWSDGQTYPPVSGLVVRVGRRETFIDASAIATLERRQILLRTARVDLNEFKRRTGEVMLGKDVLDHQLVDVDGVQVIRAADLYLAEAIGRVRLVGVDVSARTLLRRLGPSRLWTHPTPERVIDWAAIQPFGETESGAPEVRLRTSHEGLHRLRPGELADLLEDLRRDERAELLAALSPDEAADALEEMEPDELASLLREADRSTAARLLASMEPDEAAEALRDLPDEHRRSLLERMAPETATRLVGLLGYPEDSAGGFMTTTIIVAGIEETVVAVVDRLIAEREHDADIDAVAVVDSRGRLVADLPLLDLLIALRRGENVQVGSLVGDEDPVTVYPDTSADEVAKQLVEARRLSLVVVDNERPVGRILADDVLDALVPTTGRFRFPRLLQ
ncbi:MAG: magnesium transporter MgtE N-terminal domain-containing protein [Acidimicrobiales bacterium]